VTSEIFHAIFPRPKKKKKKDEKRKEKVALIPKQSTINGTRKLSSSHRLPKYENISKGMHC
jgi:hypothetical protein